MEKLGFVHYFNFLDHDGMMKMLESENVLSTLANFQNPLMFLITI